MHKKSRKLSYLLRHDPENMVMDKNGYVLVSEILKKLNISLFELEEIVDKNDKKRFSFNNSKEKIRASQGHSIKVDVELKVKIPPKFLYHGTAIRNVKSIRKNGLSKMKRNHVHLSGDYETAVNVAKRYSKTDIYIFKIDTYPMIVDNIKFYQSENGVWLVEFVDPKFI